MKKFEKLSRQAFLSSVLVTSLGACEQTVGQIQEPELCSSNQSTGERTLEIHTIIRDVEERNERLRGRERAIHILGDLLQDTQQCSISELQETVSQFNNAYRVTGDMHYAEQAYIVQSIIDVRTLSPNQERSVAIEDTI